MKKINHKKAFSLIEVIVASIILSLAVFWVFKLIWENEKLINNSDNYKTATSLFIPLIECIENIWSSSENRYIILENCTTSISETWATIDNIDYILHYDKNNDKLIIRTDSLILEKEY